MSHSDVDVDSLMLLINADTENAGLNNSNNTGEEEEAADVTESVPIPPTFIRTQTQIVII